MYIFCVIKPLFFCLIVMTTIRSWSVKLKFGDKPISDYLLIIINGCITSTQYRMYVLVCVFVHSVNIYIHISLSTQQKIALLQHQFLQELNHVDRCQSLFIQVILCFLFLVLICNYSTTTQNMLDYIWCANFIILSIIIFYF